MIGPAGEAAARAVATIGTNTAVEQLTRIFRTGSLDESRDEPSWLTSSRRVLAARALAYIAGPRTIAPLLQALADDREVREEAASALWVIVATMLGLWTVSDDRAVMHGKRAGFITGNFDIGTRDPRLDKVEERKLLGALRDPDLRQDVVYVIAMARVKAPAASEGDLDPVGLIRWLLAENSC